mmetsp:Transcript_16180/g.19771  ORF Transcript_16180/g.19771 Transcript_16180/m.19771 type:complete len:276 (-) Transcript_16180:401-1228(-)
MAQRILLKRALTTASCSKRIAVGSGKRSTSSLSSTACSIQDRNYNCITSDRYLSVQSLIHKNTNLNTRRYKSFKSTSQLYKEAETTAKVAAEAPTDEDNEIPEYQNPIHYNDPNSNKLFPEEFGPDETPELVPLPPFDDGSGKIIAAPHLHDLSDEIVNLSMLEVKELVDRVADHFGIEESDEDDFGDSGGAGGAQAEEEVKEEKTAFDLKLTAFDAKTKIKIIKEIRAMTGLGLKEAKELVEGAPKTVKKGIKMEEADELKAKLEAVGATVEID